MLIAMSPKSVDLLFCGVTTSAVQHWEQGLRAMPAPACRLLDLIEKDPHTVFSLISNDKAS